MLNSRRARQSSGVLIAAYLAVAGQEQSKRNICPDALVAAYDMHISICEQLGWMILKMDWAYAIARDLMNTEVLVTETCRICGGLYVPYANAKQCPVCLELGQRSKDAVPEQLPEPPVQPGTLSQAQGSQQPPASMKQPDLFNPPENNSIAAIALKGDALAS